MAVSQKHKGFKWTVGDASNPTLALLVDNDSRALHIAEAADGDTDWNVSADTHPTVYIHSATTPATDYIKVYHDATIGYVDIVGGTTLRLLIAGTAEIDLTASAFSPAVTDSNALGTTDLMWADLFLASGGVVNFNNGNVTLTHSAAKLDIAGGDVTIASGTGLNVGSVTQLTLSDGDGATNLIPEVQALGVGTAFAGGVVAAATFNATNTRAVSPKIALVKGAAATQVATTAVADDEVIGSIIAYGSDSADFETPVGSIEFVVEDSGGPGAGAIGGSIEFNTTADGGETLTKALTLTQAQTARFAGRLMETMSVTDVDAQNNTLSVAQIAGGIVVHTSVTAGGTVTTDTAANIIAGSSGIGVMDANGQCISCHYINDGTQVLTLAGDTGVTIADTGQTIAADEAALLVFRRVSGTTVTCYILGA